MRIQIIFSSEIVETITQSVPHPPSSRYVDTISFIPRHSRQTRQHEHHVFGTPRQLFELSSSYPGGDNLRVNHLPRPFTFLTPETGTGVHLGKAEHTLWGAKVGAWESPPPGKDLLTSEPSCVSAGGGSLLARKRTWLDNGISHRGSSVQWDPNRGQYHKILSLNTKYCNCDRRMKHKRCHRRHGFG